MRGVASRLRAGLPPGAVGWRCGFGGHVYVFSSSREAVEAVARALGRRSGVYYRADHGVWALRVRRERDKRAVREMLLWKE